MNPPKRRLSELAPRSEKCGHAMNGQSPGWAMGRDPTLWPRSALGGLLGFSEPQPPSLLVG